MKKRYLSVLIVLGLVFSVGMAHAKSSQTRFGNTYTVTCSYSDGTSWSRSGRTERQARNLVSTCRTFGGLASMANDDY